MPGTRPPTPTSCSLSPPYGWTFTWTSAVALPPRPSRTVTFANQTPGSV